jgi:hypothetical protein
VALGGATLWYVGLGGPLGGVRWAGYVGLEGASRCGVRRSYVVLSGARRAVRRG